MTTLSEISALTGTNIQSVTQSSYTWSSISLPVGVILLAVATWQAGGGVNGGVPSHPALSDVTLLRQRLGTNTGADRSCRVRIYRAVSAGGSGTLTVAIENGQTAWQCGVMGWLIGGSGIGSFLDGADAATTGDTQTSITVPANTSPAAALGLVVGAAYRVNTTPDVGVQQWTTAAASKGMNNGYFTMGGGGFVNNQPGSSPVLNLGATHGRPLVGVAVRFAAPPAQQSSNPRHGVAWP